MQKLVEEVLVLSFLFNISFPSCFFLIMLRVWKRLVNCMLLEMRIHQIIEHLYPSYHPLPHLHSFFPLAIPSFLSQTPKQYLPYLCYRYSFSFLSFSSKLKYGESFTKNLRLPILTIVMFREMCNLKFASLMSTFFVSSKNSIILRWSLRTTFLTNMRFWINIQTDCCRPFFNLYNT